MPSAEVKDEDVAVPIDDDRQTGWEVDDCNPHPAPRPADSFSWAKHYEVKSQCLRDLESILNSILNSSEYVQISAHKIDISTQNLTTTSHFGAPTSTKPS